MNEKITPLSEKRVKNIPSYDGGVNAYFFYEEDLQQHIKGFCEELKELANPCMKCGSIQCSYCSDDFEKAKLKWFGEGLI